MNKEQTAISVIVPIYNVEKYLRQCLDSIVNQTLRDIEIILIDDLGNDNSMEIAKEFAAKDKRVKIITHEKNSGLSAARNTGIKNSFAPLIMFCDSDDFYELSVCEKLLNAIESSGADLAVCGTNVIYEADNHIAKSDKSYFEVKFNGLKNISDDVLWKTDVVTWNKIYRRTILEKYEIEFPEGLRHEDAYFFNAYTCWIKTIFFINEKLYNYRRRAGSVMNQIFVSKTVHSIDHLKVGIAFYEYLKKHDLFWIRSDYMCRLFFAYLRFALQYAQTNDGQSAVYDLALDFMRREKWPLEIFSFDMRRQLQMLNKRTLLGETNKFFGGLIKVKETVNRKKIYFADIPVWEIRYKNTTTKHYLLGFIPVYKKTLVFSGEGNCANFKPFCLNNSSLLEELKNIGKFTYIPNSGNIGDMLITSATMQFFDKNKIPYKKYNGRNMQKNIVYSGGGIWTGDYEQCWIWLLPLFAKARRIIILPSSFNNCKKLTDIMDERFVVFCREKRSYVYLNAQKTGAKIILDHDMAFRMQKEILYAGITTKSDMENNILLRAAAGMTKVGRIAKFMRQDCESAGNYKTDFDLSNIAYCSFTAPKEYMDFNTKLMLYIVDSVDAVITDRLHVGIAAALMSKEVYLLDNSYGKLSGVYEQTMKDNPKVHFVTKMPCKLKPKKTATDNFKQIADIVK
ncbi:MAG: glycosyltransferase [Campylobacteraceae bacterium]|jgi:glycosyltransferase involved in cell wall biosynthesis/exopolysaccharide biosynthesis predicted pyruvyltransferase EpsI|nr:glycosyltransferase [Campylobacteraceae bacterium]